MLTRSVALCSVLALASGTAMAQAPDTGARKPKPRVEFRPGPAPAATPSSPTAPAVGRTALGMFMFLLPPAVLRAGGGDGGIDGPGCAQTSTYTDFNFGQGGSVNAQAGFGEGEMAAVSFTIPANNFPIKMNLAEILFATSGTTVTTTTKWSVIVYQGTPATGTPIFTESSDGTILPHLIMPPGNNGTIIQFSIDPGDPQQIIIQNNGSNTFSVAFRVDDHHNQTANPCFTAPPSNSNAFPATDTSGLSNGANNWLFGLNCGSFGCPPNGGWTTFSGLASFCRPSGDWVMRVSWEPVSCVPASGACCLPNGSCQILTVSQCGSQSGVYRGDNTTCATANCPAPTGACCLSNGNCLLVSSANCASLSGTYLGNGTQCNGSLCPTGACCLPSGSCVVTNTVSCSAQNGVFRGVGTACATANCPQPTGACCFTGGCIDLTQADCALIPGVWGGLGTNCAGGCGPAPCYPNCDESTVSPILNVGDFSCFIAKFANGETYANCDQSTVEPVLNVGDFGCFLSQFANGCP